MYMYTAYASNYRTKPNKHMHPAVLLGENFEHTKRTNTLVDTGK